MTTKKLDLGVYIAEQTSSFQKPNIRKVTKDSVIFESPLQDFKLNRNRRVYSRPLLETGLRDGRVQDLLKRKSWFGEAGHPNSSDMNRLSDIDQRNISHIVVEAKMGADRIESVIETANTAVGRDMKGLIEQGSQVAFSMRGFGRSKQNGDHVVVTEPFKIVCYDWVIYPSHPVAVAEGIQVVHEDTIMHLQIDDVQAALIESSEEFSFMMNHFEEVGIDVKGLKVNKDVSLAEVLTEDGRQIIPVNRLARKKLFDMF